VRENSVSGFSDILTNIGFRLSETRYKISLCVAFYLGSDAVSERIHSVSLSLSLLSAYGKKACETEKNLLEPEARHSG